MDSCQLGAHCRELEGKITVLNARKTDVQYKMEVQEAEAQVADLRAEVVQLLAANDAKDEVVADLESRVAVR